MRSLMRGPVSRCGGALCGLRAMVAFLEWLVVGAQDNDAARRLQPGNVVRFCRGAGRDFSFGGFRAIGPPTEGVSV